MSEPRIEMESPPPGVEGSPGEEAEHDVAAYRRLVEDASAWESSGRDEALLYRGARLRTIERARWELWRRDPVRFPPPGEAALRFLQTARERRAAATRSTVTAAIAALSVLVLVFAGLAVHANLRIGAQRDQHLAEQLIESSRQYVLTDGRLAQTLAAAAWNLDPSDQAWAALANAAASAATGSFSGPHGGGIDRVAASPDGTLLATADDGGSVVLWDLETGSSEAFEYRLGFPLDALEFSPDGRFLAASAMDRDLIVWDLLDRSAKPIASANATDALAFDPDATVLATGGEDGTVAVWDLATFERRDLFPVGLPITGLVFDERGERLFASEYEAGGLVVTLDAGTGELLGEADPHAEIGGIDELARRGFASSELLLCAEWDGCATAGADGQSTMVLPGAAAPAAPSLVGEEVVALHPSGGLGVWDATDGALTGVLPYAGYIDDVAFGADGSTVYAATGGALQRWDLDRMHGFAELYGGMDVKDIALTGDGRYLVSTGFGGSQVWGARSIAAPVSEHFDRAGTVVAAAGEGTLVASGIDVDHTLVEIWDAATGEVKTVLEDADGWPAASLAFSPDGSRLAVGTWVWLTAGDPSGFGVTIWDVETGAALTRLDWDESLGVESLDFSPDGALLATADAEGRVQVWDAAGGDLVETGPPGAAVHDLRFHPDGSLGASTGGGVALWPPGGLHAAPGTVENGYSASGLAFSDDGDRFAVYEDFPEPALEHRLPASRLAVFDFEHGAVAAPLPFNGFYVSIVFSADGRTVFAGGGSSIARFDIGYLDDDLYRYVCDRLDYEMSEETWHALIPDAPFGSIEVCP